MRTYLMFNMQLSTVDSWDFTEFALIVCCFTAGSGKVSNFRLVQQIYIDILSQIVLLIFLFWPTDTHTHTQNPVTKSVWYCIIFWLDCIYRGIFSIKSMVSNKDPPKFSQRRSFGLSIDFLYKKTVASKITALRGIGSDEGWSPHNTIPFVEGSVIISMPGHDALTYLRCTGGEGRDPALTWRCVIR